jgi:hypothetical protein
MLIYVYETARLGRIEHVEEIRDLHIHLNRAISARMDVLCLSRDLDVESGGDGAIE